MSNRDPHDPDGEYEGHECTREDCYCAQEGYAAAPDHGSLPGLDSEGATVYDGWTGVETQDDINGSYMPTPEQKEYERPFRMLDDLRMMLVEREDFRQNAREWEERAIVAESLVPDSPISADITTLGDDTCAGEFKRETVTQQAIALILEREKMGTRTYGKPLFADAKSFLAWADDAIDEAADQLQYLIAMREALATYLDGT